MKKPEQFDEMLNSTNFNYNRLIAIDTISTNEDEILEICIYPLNNNYEPAKTIIPFFINIQPRVNPWNFTKEHYKKLGITQLTYLTAWNDGLPLSQAIELFERWCEHKIQMLPGRKLMPLTYDWGTKKTELIKFLGHTHFEHYFHFHARDILSVSLFANDFANMQVERPPYPKVDMTYIFSQTRTEMDRKNTMINCVGISKIYRKMLNSFYVGHVRTRHEGTPV